MPEKAPAKPDQTLLDLKDTATAIQKLATSVEQFPGRMVEQTGLIKESFWSGAGIGFIVGVVIMCALVVISDRIDRKG